MFRRAWNRLLVLLNRRPVTALGWYWVIALIATHVPPFLSPGPPEPEAIVGKDKIAHFVGYAVLAYLLMNAMRPLRLTHILVPVGICVVYGVIDELTQPPFGRTADGWDYVADLIGMTVGILIFFKPRSKALPLGS